MQWCVAITVSHWVCMGVSLLYVTVNHECNERGEIYDVTNCKMLRFCVHTESVSSDYLIVFGFVQTISG